MELPGVLERFSKEPPEATENLEELVWSYLPDDFPVSIGPETDEESMALGIQITSAIEAINARLQMITALYDADEKNIGLANINSLDTICDLIEFGGKLARFYQRNQMPDQIKTSELVAYFFFKYVESGTEGLDSRRKVKKHTNLYRPPPFIRMNYSGNKQ